LAALEPRFGLAHLCERAKEKDAGFSRAVLLEMLGHFDRLDRDEFDLNAATFDHISESIVRWRDELENTR
jgi:hypothetical protein